LQGQGIREGYNTKMNLRGLEFEVCGQDSMGSGESKYGLM